MLGSRLCASHSAAPKAPGAVSAVWCCRGWLLSHGRAAGDSLAMAPCVMMANDLGKGFGLFAKCVCTLQTTLTLLYRG